MAASKILPFLFLAIFCSIHPKAVAIEAITVTIHIIVDLPASSGITTTDCIGEEWKLKPGEHFEITRWPDRRYICKADQNGTKQGSWLAFDPLRDLLRTDVFCSVREDGFYFSYDQSSWLKLNGWDH
ncbi:hypothetical protein COLO4_34093 [Corchorus olitorius]|uniref:Plant self-incompatibility S1 n=1 Tax=Corchorus olitorius TaxID=93759 RepID=A0A1R3GNX6_9ROSI|nr:hypothetical protein COLO4_34093 [Corchorus olitorius]